ncbi:uncharacterized protein Z519_03792 [Cladophialophora bantiana CBS 173.52]|uniref:Uncharacterized protein n=1 Tax=Cladophialophora bantiana (strain ATCC 10958 / CBS 173.52 / CDC B-1940 / NIH 8579) TaxID=1442370 RepID=A0A0D2HP83_CLAB1|nr:uncharacterized protein Z519_03792 [Cladophialophora bantiana CBS 173.52]KIW95208.1 hypothetical protein Z519_03792 [Cladophialophora bantiana CBS 173.52]
MEEEEALCSKRHPRLTIQVDINRQALQVQEHHSPRHQQERQPQPTTNEPEIGSESQEQVRVEVSVHPRAQQPAITASASSRSPALALASSPTDIASTSSSTQPPGSSPSTSCVQDRTLCQTQNRDQDQDHPRPELGDYRTQALAQFEADLRAVTNAPGQDHRIPTRTGTGIGTGSFPPRRWPGLVEHTYDDRDYDHDSGYDSEH